MLILAAAVLLGGVAQPGAEAPAAAKKDAGDQVVCRSRARTGTRFATKTCMKRKDIDEAAERDRRVVADEYQLGAKSNPPEGAPR